jgi:acyl-homoserine-lactone acylase
MKWFKRIALSFGVFLVLAAVGLAFWEPMSVIAPAAPAVQKYDVKIARDEFGVPHIFGKRDADTAYGIAYAHAEDDFSTLQYVLAMTRGRAGALNGKEGLQVDYAYNLLGVKDTVDRDFAKLPTDIIALLDGYAAGLNRYAEKHPKEIAMRKLFPATAKDIAAGFVLRSPFFFGLGDTIGALVEGKDLPVEGGSLGKAPKQAETAWMTPIGKEPTMNGSNAFAVAAKVAPDKITRLLSNSHQPWRGQVAWYELVVHSEQGWDFAGATFPGSPFPFLGHNKTLGWTNTVNRPDLTDVYKLVTSPDGNRYKMDGAWKPLTQNRVWLKLKWGPFVIPLPQTFLRSEHGPAIHNDKGVFAMRYGGMDQLKMLEEYFRLNKARNFAEWQQALAIQGVPATNFIYGDAAGNIGLFYNAAFPTRHAGYDWQTVLPGDRSDAISGPTVPWAQIPRNVNPGSGYIFNANNTPLVAAGPGDEIDPALLGVERDMTNRANRAVGLLEGVSWDGKIDAAELSAVKYDRGYARKGYVAAWFDALMAVKTKVGSNEAKGQALLDAWDWAADGKGKGDALALLLMREAMGKAYKRLALPDASEALTKATSHLQTYFGTLDPPLGTLLRLRQGKVDLPLDGGSDTLRASTLWDVDSDGRLSVKHGDSFVMFIEWAVDGSVTSRSMQPFGAATTRPGSQHYTDQAKLFVEKKTKPVYFTYEALKPHIQREYRP